MHILSHSLRLKTKTIKKIAWFRCFVQGNERAIALIHSSYLNEQPHSYTVEVIVKWGCYYTTYCSTPC